MEDRENNKRTAAQKMKDAEMKQRLAYERNYNSEMMNVEEMRRTRNKQFSSDLQNQIESKHQRRDQAQSWERQNEEHVRNLSADQEKYMRQAELEEARMKKSANQRMLDQREAELKNQDEAGRAKRESAAAQRLAAEEAARFELAQKDAIRKANEDTYRVELLDQINNRHRQRDNMTDMEHQKQMQEVQNNERMRQGLAAEEAQLRKGKYEEAQDNKAQWADLQARRDANKQRDADEDRRLREAIEMRNNAEAGQYAKMKHDQQSILRNNLQEQMNERNNSANKNRKHDLNEADQLRQSWDKQNQWMAHEEMEAKVAKVREADRIKAELDANANRKNAQDMEKANREANERDMIERNYKEQMQYLSQQESIKRHEFRSDLQTQIEHRCIEAERAKLEEETLWKSPSKNQAVHEEGWECKGCVTKGDHHKYSKAQLSKIKHTKRDAEAKARGEYKSSYKDRYLKSQTYHQAKPQAE